MVGSLCRLLARIAELIRRAGWLDYRPFNSGNFSQVTHPDVTGAIFPSLGRRKNDL
jgi:hypothetical protein